MSAANQYCKKGNTMKKFLILAVLIISIASSAKAYPTLQVAINGGIYHGIESNEVLSESVVTSSSLFDVGAIFTPSPSTNGKKKPTVPDPNPNQNFQLIMAFTNPDGSPITSSTGSIKVNHILYNLSSFEFGGPTGLASHGVYETIYKAIDFNFSNGIKIDKIDVAENPGTWLINSSGKALLKTFEIDRSAIGDYLIQFDLIANTGSHLDYFAPFSHDGASMAEVSEPTTLILFGTFLLGFGTLRKRV